MKISLLTYTINGIEMNHFEYGYIVGALTSVQESNPLVFLHLSDINKDDIKKMMNDCKKFFMENNKLLNSLPDGYAAEECGYDFWRTRNGKSAYWEMGEEKPLTNAALAFGPQNVMIIDGKIRII